MDLSDSSSAWGHSAAASSQPASGASFNAGQIGEQISGYFGDYLARMALELTASSIWLQVAAIIIAPVLAYVLIRMGKAMLGSLFGDSISAVGGDRHFPGLARAALPALSAGLLWLFIASFADLGLPLEYMRVAAAVFGAIAASMAVSGPQVSRFWSRTVSGLAWIAALLTILRIFSTTVEFFDTLSLPFGEDLSALDLVKALAVAVAVALVWTAAFLARMAEARLRSSAHITPSVRGLLSQLVRILLIGAAVVFALGTLGIDLTAFAVFTGALGVGIGFGLQSIFSNFMAGIIIILEKTLEVGDFIDLEGGITGEVQEINIRSTLIRTNDNVDMLIPNSEFISKRVINWTLREAQRRIHVPVGVAYGTDKDLVKKALLEAADNVEFTLKGVAGRGTDVWLTNFGDSSLDFELIVWLTDDATKRPAKVHAAYCWEIETQLAKYNITIPFPQRDLHLIRDGK